LKQTPSSYDETTTHGRGDRMDRGLNLGENAVNTKCNEQLRAVHILHGEGFWYTRYSGYVLHPWAASAYNTFFSPCTWTGFSGGR